MKRVVFYGTSLETIRGFPNPARREAGYQIDRVQHGLDPTDWKPMASIGPGVREIRVRSEGQFRVIYLAALPNRIAVLHAFRKKARRISQADMQQARQALKQAMSGSRS